MPMMGKYFVYYWPRFFCRRATWARNASNAWCTSCITRTAASGRFHRKWSEVIVDEIISAHYRFPVDYKAHQFELANAIYELDGAAVVPWESERTIDMIWQYLERRGETATSRTPSCAPGSSIFAPTNGLPPRLLGRAARRHRRGVCSRTVGYQRSARSGPCGAGGLDGEEVEIV